MVLKLVNFVCIKCGKQVEAPNKASVVCTCCGRIMWREELLRNEDLIREEMVLNFNEYLKTWN